MTLDFQTLLACYALVRVLQAVGLVYVWSIHRRYAPLRELALGSVIVAIGTLSLSSTAEPSLGLLTVVQTMLLGVGALVFNIGIVRLADRPAPWAIGIGWTAACIAAWLYVPLVLDSPIYPVIITTVFFVVCLGYAAIALLRAPDGPLSGTQRIIATLLFVQIAGLIERCVVLVRWGDAAAPMLSSAAQTAFLLATIGSSFLLTLSIAVLANQRLQRALDLAASVDPLTGLMNRRAFTEIVERDWARAVRNNRRLSMLLLDLDHFKSVNDLFGHRAGDAVLRKVADTLAGEVRTGDVLCRFGGEEFIVLMPDTPVGAANAVAERLRLAVATLTEDLAPGMPITISIGVAEKSATESSWEQLVAAADKVLYAAKQAGRNRVVVADDFRKAA
ncbi:MAG: GGDEF domain-containing protein [Bauldia sp.]|nr:GGDEF domain-containing protein [Bauldia sp.]